jgi:hypothetical protein
MHNHNHLASLSCGFVAESSCGNFENVKQIVKMVSEDELKFLLGHVGFEIYQFIDEMFSDEENYKKCFEYFQKKQREVMAEEDMT